MVRPTLPAQRGKKESPLTEGHCIWSLHTFTYTQSCIQTKIEQTHGQTQGKKTMETDSTGIETLPLANESVKINVITIF